MMSALYLLQSHYSSVLETNQEDLLPSLTLTLTTLDSDEKVDSLDTVMALQIESPTSRVLVRTSQGSALPLLTLTGHWSVSPSCLLSPVWARLCSPAAPGSQLIAQAEK